MIVENICCQGSILGYKLYFRSKVGEEFISWVLGNVEFITEKRACAPYLQDTFPTVHDGNFILAHKLFATLSSDEFNFYTKKAGTLSNLCSLSCCFLLYCIFFIYSDFKLDIFCSSQTNLKFVILFYNS